MVGTIRGSTFIVTDTFRVTIVHARTESCSEYIMMVLRKLTLKQWN